MATTMAARFHLAKLLSDLTLCAILFAADQLNDQSVATFTSLSNHTITLKQLTLTYSLF